MLSDKLATQATQAKQQVQKPGPFTPVVEEHAECWRTSARWHTKEALNGFDFTNTLKHKEADTMLSHALAQWCSNCSAAKNPNS